MNEDEFVQQAQQDPTTAAFLGEVADEVRGGPPPGRFVGGGFLDPMQLAAAYAVWSLLKLGIATLRSLIGLELAKRTGEVVAFLVAKGYPHEVAEKTVKNVLDNLLKQSDDSPILQTLLRLLPNQSPTSPPKSEEDDEKTDAPKKDGE